MLPTYWTKLAPCFGEAIIVSLQPSKPGMELITLPSGGMIVKIPGFIIARLSRNPFGNGILFSPYIWVKSLNIK
jgi:hypothetical protein